MVDSEVWVEVEGFPDYMISDEGRVYNNRAGIMMSLSKTMQGDLKVTMVNGADRVTRSIRVLVAEAFVHNPHPYQDDDTMAFDTVIVLDGNKNHVDSRNLAWRPWWFAYEYARQFHMEQPPEYYSRPVCNTQTGWVYNSMFECVVQEGLLLKNLYQSITEEVAIFPTNTVYIWARV